MKFACFSLDFRRFPLERAFAAARRYGFDGVEVWGGRPHACPFDVDKELVKALLHMKSSYGLEVPMYTPNAIGLPYRLCVPDVRERRDAMQYFKAAIDACAAMEIPRMLLVADHPGYEAPMAQSRRIFAENVRELGEYAAPQGVVLVLEPLTPMESPVLTTADDCAQMLEAVALENVEAMLDIVPPFVAHEPLSSYFEKLGGRMHYIHLCGGDCSTDAHLRLEHGSIPVADVMKLFLDYGFDDYVTVELYSEGYSDPELMLANSARVLGEIRRTLQID